MTKGGVPGVRRANWSQQDLVSTYFDTNKRKLKRSGLTLRVRQVDNKFVQTVKSTASGNFTRANGRPRSIASSQTLPRRKVRRSMISALSTCPGS
ncbi:CYTH domain-containing protein [Bradyrhizobium sp. USDA 4011]